VVNLLNIGNNHGSLITILLRKWVRYVTWMCEWIFIAQLSARIRSIFSFVYIRF